MSGYKTRVQHMIAILERELENCQYDAGLAGRAKVVPAETGNMMRAKGYKAEIAKLRSKSRDRSVDERLSETVADALRGSCQKEAGSLVEVGIRLAACTLVQADARKIEQKLDSKTTWKTQVGMVIIHPTWTQPLVEEDLVVVSQGGRETLCYLAPAGLGRSERYIYSLARAGGDGPERAEAAAREATGVGPNTYKQRPEKGQVIC